MEFLLLEEAVLVQPIFIDVHRLLLEHPPTRSHQIDQQSSLSMLTQNQSHNQFLEGSKLQAIL